MAEDGRGAQDMGAREDGGQAFQPPRARRLIAAGVIAASILLVDQLSKAWVRGTIALTGETLEVIPGVISFWYVTNTGAAFSLGEGMGLVFVLLALVVTVAAAWYLATTRAVSWFEVVGLAMVVGGAIGNAIDRVAFGYVTDFIATEFIDFPVFNVADIGVTVGVAVAFIGFVFLNPEGREEEGAEGGDVEGGERR